MAINYTDANGESATFNQNINGSGNTTITVKVGTSMSYTLTRTSTRNSVSFTSRYDANNGTIIWNNVTADSNTPRTGNLNLVAAGAGVTLSCGIYRGFYGWRVKRLSGVTINGYEEGDIIPAETQIEFVTENAEGNEVDFEALWAQAYVVTSNTATGLHTGVSYERNFIVGATPSALNVPVKVFPFQFW